MSSIVSLDREAFKNRNELGALAIDREPAAVKQDNHVHEQPEPEQKGDDQGKVICQKTQ
jgi:hypothetical protein